MKKAVLLIQLLISLTAISNIQSSQELNSYPEQVHLSYGSTPDQMIVTWVTLDYVAESIVEYGIADFNEYTKGVSEIFVDGGKESRKITIHRTILTNLLPNKTYRYHCGSRLFGWSSIFSFTTMPTGSDWSPRFAIFGDMGNTNAQSLARLQEETMLGYYDAILHVGDFAYNMDDDNGRVGDAFFNQIESIAGYLPYMACVGNHENAYNFSNYVSRFSMPSNDGKSIGGENNHFFSINIGPIHLISFSTEFYYFLEYGFTQVKRQYEWLEADLKKANLNRPEQPWIITMGHRPMYCSNENADDCNNYDDRIRIGFPFVNTYGLEDLFYKYGVDLTFWAHEHSYERFWPVYNETTRNGSYEKPYTNPGAPVHIVTGSAGCNEKHDSWGPLKNITAFRSADYGYTRMQVYNRTHLYLEQVSDDQDGKIIDDIWLIKDSHGSF
jgi:hypothetical protein